MSLAISPFDPRKPKQQLSASPSFACAAFCSLLITHCSLCLLRLLSRAFAQPARSSQYSGLIGVEQAAESQTEDSTAQIPQGSSPVSQSQVRLDRSQLSRAEMIVTHWLQTRTFPGPMHPAGKASPHEGFQGRLGIQWSDYDTLMYLALSLAACCWPLVVAVKGHDFLELVNYNSKSLPRVAASRCKSLQVAANPHKVRQPLCAALKNL